jgi:hypothetical protein
VLFIKYYAGGEIKGIKWSRQLASKTEVRIAYKSDAENLKASNHLEEQGLDEKTVCTHNYIKEIGYARVERIRLPQHRVWWRAIVNTVMNIRVA